jgi:molybdopterin-guanine dinucleotide biosynthesis protein B
MHVTMKKPAVIGFYGESKTGKTTLIIEIIKRLTNEGLKVATVKITDKNIGIDTEGKDTWKYSKAGSELVVF